MGLPEAVSRCLSAGAQSTPVAVPKADRPALRRRFMASMPDYRNQWLGRPPDDGRPLVITPAGAPPSFMDHLQQLELRAEGLIARTLAGLIPPHDHNAHQAPGRNILPDEVVRAGLVALSRHQIIRSSRPRFPAGLPRCCTGFSRAAQDKRHRSADLCQRPGRSVPDGGSSWQRWTCPRIEGSSGEMPLCGAASRHSLGFARLGVPGCRGRVRVEVDRMVVVLDGLFVPP